MKNHLKFTYEKFLRVYIVKKVNVISYLLRNC